jgi:hypothetical protein
MNTQATQTTRPQPALHYAGRAVPDSYDWEELPSLANRLRRPDFGHSATPVWESTQPLDLPASEPDEMAPSPFRETLSGLHVREIAGDEVFQHFFGEN